MRAHLIVSALFAASLFCGGALADRPGDDGGGRTARMPNIREMRMRETREPTQREARPHETPNTRVRDPQVMERLRARGDMVDRTGGARTPAAQGKAAAGGDAAALKAQREAAKALKGMEAKKNARINCAPGDDSCGASARSAAAAATAAERAQQKAAADKQRTEVQKALEKVRAEKLRDKIRKAVCEKHANMCDSNL